jgi:hypothetical protein
MKAEKLASARLEMPSCFAGLKKPFFLLRAFALWSFLSCLTPIEPYQKI